VPAGTAIADLGVFQRQAAEGQQDFTIFDDGRPAGLRVQIRPEFAQHMGHDHLGGGKTVGIH